MSYLSKFFKTSPRFSRGFTLAEMITVTAIFVIITGILLTNLPDFKSKTNIDVAAQQIALNIRGAQVYSIGTKAGTGANSDGLLPSFGIYFNKNLLKNSYILYQDTREEEEGGNPDGRYNPQGNPGSCIGECEEIYKIDPYFFISRVCVDTTFAVSGGLDCSARTSLDAFFKRPKVQAQVSGDGVWTDVVSFGAVELCSNRNKETCRVVKVYKSGQVEILKAKLSTN